jgi:hypothetical protein
MDDSTDLADGIIPNSIPEHIRPKRTSFLPWHKVRKQYVREKQWNFLAKNCFKNNWRSDLQKYSELEPQSSIMHIKNPLRFLTLPGSDLLDIQALWGGLRELDCCISYLGFNSGEGSKEPDTDVFIANNRVTSLEGVVPNSIVQKDRFETIASEKSQAYKSLKEYGPYHIVNLDLCGTLFPNIENNVEPLYNAIHALLNYQLREQTKSWLLFATTVVKPIAVDATKFNSICTPIKENAKTHKVFAEKIEALFPKTALNIDGDGVNLNGLSSSQIVSFFGAAFGKVLLSMCHSANPKWGIVMRRSFSYVVNEETDATMLSLAFEFVPTHSPPVDPTGMSKQSTVKVKVATEEECAINIIDMVRQIADVDDILENNEEVKILLRDSSAALLEDAGYNREAYLKWIEDGEMTDRNQLQTTSKD